MPAALLKIVVPRGGVKRQPDGTLNPCEALFLTYYDEATDSIKEEPLGWKAACLIFGDDYVRGRIDHVRPNPVPAAA